MASPPTLQQKSECNTYVCERGEEPIEIYTCAACMLARIVKSCWCEDAAEVGVHKGKEGVGKYKMLKSRRAREA